MAAATLVLNVQQDVTLSGTPGNQRLVNLPTGARYLRIRPRTNGIKARYGVSIADEDAIGAAAYDTIDGDVVERVPVGGLAPTCALSSATASVVVEMTAIGG